MSELSPKLFFCEARKDETKHRELTGVSNRHILPFARQLAEEQIPIWVRHVLVSGKYDEKDLNELSSFISTLSNVEKVEILLDHQLGVYKWEELCLSYPLADVSPPADEEVNRAKVLLNIQ